MVAKELAFGHIQSSMYVRDIAFVFTARHSRIPCSTGPLRRCLALHRHDFYSAGSRHRSHRRNQAGVPWQFCFH